MAYESLRLATVRGAGPGTGNSSRLAKHRELQGRSPSGITPAAKAKPAAKRALPAAQTAAQRIASAKSEAKARAAVVLASEAYPGRERQAAELLLASCDRNSKLNSSTAIIAELRARDTDAELSARMTSKKQVETQASQADSDAAWAKAYGQSDAGAPERSVDATWARAYKGAAA